MKQERAFPRLSITKKAEASVRLGHPWIYDAEVRGETDVLNREMQSRVDELRKERLRLARVSGEVSRMPSWASSACSRRSRPMRAPLA